MVEYAELITLGLSVAGIIGVPSLVIGLALARKKLSQFRIFVDSVDDALKDNAVSESEFATIFENGKALISKS